MGIPLSGKDTFIHQGGFEDFEVISRDEIILRLGLGEYRKDYATISGKLIDKLFFQALSEAAKLRKNVVVNATNITLARRRKILLRFPDYHKTALVFPLLDFDTFCKRNEIRSNGGGKYIPLSVYQQMLSIYESVQDAEGFDLINQAIPK